jgi:hypothetical protein
MECLDSLLVTVWREACRQRELEPALTEIAPHLLAQLPVAQVLVRRFDAAGHCVEAVATATCRGGSAIVDGRTDLTADEFAALMAWSREPALAHWPAEQRSSPRGLFPVGVFSAAIAGPLRGEAGPIGVAIFVAADQASFDARHERFLRLVLEPLGAWLENDVRRRELAALRATAGVESSDALLPSGEFAPLDVAMARHIETALRRTHGRIEGPFGAARLLQINPHTLRGRMRHLGVDWRRFRSR